MKKTQTISVGDELNLYLVANGLKPASYVALDLLNFEEGYNIKRQGNTVTIYEDSDIKLKPEHIAKFRSYLDELGVSHQPNEPDLWQTYNQSGKPIKAERILFQIGKDRKSLDKLITAETDEEIGTALEYPVEAVSAYDQIIDSERRDGQYVQVALAKAKQTGIEIPSWLAYISHVPEELDLVNGKVSETSKALGERYQNFVRANNPGLAKRVEQHFASKRLPDTWEKTSNGSYATRFNYPK